MKTFYLPLSSCELSSEQLRESMRRWHWARYFQLLRRAARTPWDYGNRQAQIQAKMHRYLASSLESRTAQHFSGPWSGKRPPRC